MADFTVRKSVHTRARSLFWSKLFALDHVYLSSDHVDTLNQKFTPVSVRAICTVWMCID